MTSNSSGNALSAPHVIVATSGTVGDIAPFVLLAQGLAGRGHRVTMLVPQTHEALVKSHGLRCVPFGTDEAFQALLADPKLWDEKKGFGVVWRSLAPHLAVIRDLVAEQRDGSPCTLLCHPLMVPSADLARAARPGLRIVAAYLAPSNLCSSHDLLTAGAQRIPSWMPLSWRRGLWRLIFKTWIDPVTLPSLNACRAANGLVPVTGFFDHMYDAPDVSIGLFPAWFAPVQPDWPSPFVAGDFPVAPGGNAGTLPPELERFLADGDAPIGFTPGTGHRHAAQYFTIALDTLKRLKRRGLFITPYFEQVPRNLPPHVMWVAQAPFPRLLPRLAALVHHGGIGTTSEAFRAGIAQVVAPFAFDQFDNGWRAHRLGVAEVLLPRQVSERRLYRALQRLLASPDVARSCAAVAAQAATGEWPRLIEEIEQALGVVPGPSRTAA